MRTINLSKALAVALLLLTPWLVQAAGLGRLSVQSGLGQPLSAEIDLVAVRGDEASSLNARLASPDDYRNANLQYNSAITGLKLSIEKRPNGQSFLKVTGNRPVNEPFIDLLIELSWSGGKLVREYTALLDPPGYGQQAQATAAPAPAAAPAVPESRPIAAPAPAPAAAAPPPAPAAAGPMAQEYGPIARGETLGKIAGSLKPEGISLEQMMVGLYRSNPDAFIRKNLNLVKSGKILRVPDQQELAAIPQGEAVKEYRTQVADWRAYSGRVADAAGAASEGGSTARGKITASVDSPATDSKDVVKLSKGEAGTGGKPLTAAAKANALQEELVARTRELAEANERIAQLEKTIKDAQKLAELKSPGMAAAQQQAEAAKAGKPEPAKAAPAAVNPEMAPAPKAEMKPEQPAAEAKKDDVAAAPPADKPVAEAAPAPKPKPKPVAPPPPPPEPDMIDMVMENLPLIGGAAVVVLGGLGFAAMRRRRARAQDDEDLDQIAPTFAGGAAGAQADAAADAAVAVDQGATSATTEEVDPIAEAEVYIAYGRDGQAEEILKEAMGRDPSREDVQVKLAEVYAARQDATAFGTIADSMNVLTGGTGDNWTKIAALGYALDPENPSYAAGKGLAAAASPAASAVGTDLDFELGGEEAGTPDIALDAGEPAGQKTEMSSTQTMAAAADAGMVPDEPAMPDFDLDSTVSSGPPDVALEATEAGKVSSIDFNIELPAVDEPAKTEAAKKPEAPATDAGLDFKIDVGDLNIDLDDHSTTAAAPSGEGKDSHWYDVQQKFDLAKAYQEMGDNEGAREILQEVIAEGDTEQKDQAQKLMGTLA